MSILRTGILSGIHNVDLGISEHLSKHHLLTYASHTDTDLVIDVSPFSDLIWQGKVICPTREAHDHRKRALLYT